MPIRRGFPYPLRYFHHKGKQWEYIVAGKGKTFVILPGGGETAETNFRFIRALENSYRVIVPTIYDVDSISGFNSALNAILAKEKAKKIILYGLSMGGQLAQTYARDYPDKVQALILSHSCTPKSKLYKRKIITPLTLAKFILPIIPNGFIKFTSRFASALQGDNDNVTSKYKVKLNSKDKKYYKKAMADSFERFFNKRLIQTWINIHLEFSKQNLRPKDFSYLKDRVLILRTDNDPLMQDEGDFQRLYPKATVHMFKDTGHLTFYYQMDEMVRVIKEFCYNALS